MSSSTPNPLPSFPVPQLSPPAMQSTTTNGPVGSSSLTLTVPQPHATTSSGATLHLPSPVLPSSSSHSGQLSSHLSLHNSAISSSSSLGIDTMAQRREIREAWIDAEGEIPVLNKDDDSWTPIRYGTLARNGPDGKSSWRDGLCVLLDSHLLFFEKETSSSRTTKSSHIFRPIRLECLRLASFSDDPEMRKQHVGLLKRVRSRFRLSPKKEPMYPFTVFHVAAKITRRYTLYTKSMTERNKWKAALESAIEARKSQQDTRMSYEPQVLNDDFFKIPPRIQFTRGTYYTGRVTCAVTFSFQGGDYIAIGCATGIYISKNAVDHSFRKVLEFNEPTSVAAIPEFDKFIVHCESALYSYSLELAILVSQGDAASKPSLENSEEKLAQGHGDVLFFKAGSLADRTLIVYASKSSKKVTSRVFELSHQGQGPQIPANPRSSYQPLGLPVPIPEDPHDATIFLDKVAVYTSKAIYMIEPMNVTDPCHKVVLELPNSRHDANAFQRLRTRMKASLKLGKIDTPKVLELVGKASILGVTNENNMLVVYNDLGCFVDQAGNPARPSYFVEWERKAEAFARCGPHLLLFSPGYIEVRDVDTGKLVRMVETRDLRLLRSGSTEWPKLVAAMTSKGEDGGYMEKVVELVRSGN